MKIESIFAMAESVAGSPLTNEDKRKSLGCVLALLVAFGLALTGPPSAQAQTFTSLYSFKGAPDGANPSGGLAIDAEGNIYGTTQFGGRGSCNSGGPGCGTVFKLVGEKEIWVYSFRGSPDGAVPSANLTADGKGNFYGATTYGGLSAGTCTTDGSVGCGTIFKINSAGRESVLYRFKGGEDGSSPFGGFVIDAAGNIYGTTQSGGGSANCGTLFKVTTAGKETVLYRFCSEANCADGSAPGGNLARDTVGNLYGTTTGGGAYAGGAVFKLAANGEETVLHSFCVNADCSDGAFPYGGVTIDADGNLYGGASFGGAFGYGTVFEVNPSGQETVLHSFAGPPDGSVPLGGMVRDAVGNLYGTTEQGGVYSEGSVFSLDASGHESVLYSFPGVGAPLAPLGALIMDNKGNLYGTTYYGGIRTKCSAVGCGTVFKLTP